MGIISSSFKFLVGTGAGIYIAQTYDIPDMKKLVTEWVFVAKHVEETYRKPGKEDN